MTGRGRRGRRLARAMLVAAGFLDGLLLLLLLSAPSTMGSMFQEPPRFVGWLVPAFGITLNLVGLAWMIRIDRTDPEGAPSSWRAVRDS